MIKHNIKRELFCVKKWSEFTDQIPNQCMQGSVQNSTNQGGIENADRSKQ